MSNLQFTTLPTIQIDGPSTSSNLFTNESSPSPSTNSSSSHRLSNSLRRSSRSSKFTDSYKIDDDSSLHKINRRVISKPKKNTFINGTENEIKKFYLNRKLTKIKPTCLETIFEAVNEESLEIAEDECESIHLSPSTSTTSQVKKVGIKKLKRSLSFSDGHNISKALVQRRKKRIQTYLGGKPKTQKCTMAAFMEKINNMHKSDTETMEMAKSSEMDQ